MTSNNNNEMPDVEETLHGIWLLISEGKYQEALAKFYDCENNYPNDENLQFNKAGLLIDAGSGLKDPVVVQRGVEVGEQNLQDKRYEKYQITTLYNLANGYSSLFQLSEKGSGIESIPQSDNLLNQH
jgi:hypothetical protein